jgi:polar amino acid transport system substrate-binding protein
MSSLRSPFTGLALILTLFLVGCADMQSKPGSSASATPVMDRIQDRGALVLGTAGDMAPLNMTSKEGKVIGVEIDLARDLATAMGVELQIETMPFGELLGALEAGKVDIVMSGMTMTPKRNTKVAFVGPYMRSGKALLTKSESIARAKDFSEVNDGGLKLTALSGSTSESVIQALAPKAQLASATSYDAAIAMVLNDEVDAMVADYTICVVALLRHPNAGLISVIAPVTYEPLGIALPPNDPLLVNFVENQLGNFEASGRLERINKRWLSNSAWIDQLP